MNVTVDSPDVGRFRDRRDAGYQLAWALKDWKGRRPLVLGIPRGGMILADVVARELDGELDVVLVEKLRAAAPSHLAIGSVAENGLVFRNDGWEGRTTGASLKAEIEAALARLRQRRLLYETEAGPVSPAGRAVIVVDDGVATGASLLGALQAMQLAGVRRLIAAVATAARDSIEALRREADEVVSIAATDSFYAVSPFFMDFAEVTDEEVVRLLRNAPRSSPRGQAV